jgi:S1-C subfamily serine protease
MAFWSYKPLGLQTWDRNDAVDPKAAAEFGAESGLIVVAVRPDSPGAEAGVLEGDVIESVDGKIVSHEFWSSPALVPRQKKHTLAIVRAREKKKVVVEVKE